MGLSSTSDQHLINFPGRVTVVLLLAILDKKDPPSVLLKGLQHLPDNPRLDKTSRPLTSQSCPISQPTPFRDEMVKVGIIGGSGLEDPQILKDPKEVAVETPFGQPSDSFLVGTIHGVECILLARHGRKHDITPTNVNFRANLWAMHHLGATVIIASTACGSLQEHVQPGQLVFPDSVFDRTSGRKSSFFDGSVADFPGVCHIQMHPAYNEKLRQILISTATELNIEHQKSGFAVCIEGPRFSTRAESCVFRSWGASLVNMTMMPECALAKELGIPYATTALATDYDCWKEEEHVSMELVMQTFKENAEKAKALFVAAVEKIAAVDWTEEVRDMKTKARHSVMVGPEVVIPALAV